MFPCITALTLSPPAANTAQLVRPSDASYGNPCILPQCLLSIFGLLAAILQISRMENLGGLQHLSCLWLEHNAISEITCLDGLLNLKVSKGAKKGHALHLYSFLPRFRRVLAMVWRR